MSVSVTSELLGFLVSLSLRLEDLLGPVTRVKKKKKRCWGFRRLGSLSRSSVGFLLLLQVSEFGVQGSGFRVQGSGGRVQGVGFRG